VVELRADAAYRGAKSCGTVWLRVAGRSGGTTRIGRHGGGDGADMRGPLVSSRRESIN
jgi:hypothetical protein